MCAVCRADLHVHTCLSPCGEDEMRPLAIARRAKEKGLDVIGICDHNATGNVEAVRRACERSGVAVVGGVEICSEEEVHMMGLFDDGDALKEMQKVIDENLEGENDADLFGDQLLCDEHDVVIGTESKLLIGAVSLRLDEVVEHIHRLSGLAIASHVDREAFGLISQLGFIPDGLPVDALEVSSMLTVLQISYRFPRIRKCPLVRFSDAHRLEEIGIVSTEFRCASPCVKELRRALAEKDGFEVTN